MNKPQISIESYHILNRAKETAFYAFLIKKSGENNNLFNLLSANLLSYINEDVSDVLNELKSLGLCDAYIPPPSSERNNRAEITSSFHSSRSQSMSRKKKSPAKKPTRHTDLFAEVSAEVKEFRRFMVGKTASHAEAVYAHLRALEDAVGDVENAVDDINFCDDGIVKADGTFADLRDRAIAVATLALSLVKEIEPRKAAPLARSVRLSNGAGFSYSTLSREEAIGRLRLMASRPGADVEFFSSDDPLPN